VELGFDDVAMQSVSLEALVRAVCVLLGAEGAESAKTAAAARLREDGARAFGEERAPVAVGAARDRDVFFARAPRDMDLAAFCARRERLARATLVLVPTARWVPLEVASRHAGGEKVEVLALEDALEIRDGSLALVGRPVAPAPGPTKARAKAKAAAREARRASPGIAALLGVTAWNQIRMAEVDGHTLRVEGNGKSMLCTFVELGFADGRKNSVEPIIAWSVLMLMVAKGRMMPSEYARFGKRWAPKKGLEKLRVLLCAAFGLEPDPIQRYFSKTGWVPKFRVAAPR
jgi:hypothetical protein